MLSPQERCCPRGGINGSVGGEESLGCQSVHGLPQDHRVHQQICSIFVVLRFHGEGGNQGKRCLARLLRRGDRNSREIMPQKKLTDSTVYMYFKLLDYERHCTPDEKVVDTGFQHIKAVCVCLTHIPPRKKKKAPHSKRKKEKKERCFL